jgi:hypothetical protein
MNCNKAYSSYKDWWIEHRSSGDYPPESEFEGHLDSMSLYEFMELLTNWDVE